MFLIVDSILLYLVILVLRNGPNEAMQEFVFLFDQQVETSVQYCHCILIMKFNCDNSTGLTKLEL